MNRRAVQLILVAALVAVAGCAGGMGGDPATDSTDDSSVTDSSGGTGTAAFYVSDEPNAIGDFDHLNVTITKVGFKQASGGDNGDSSEDGDNESESDDGGNETSTDATDDETDGNETDTAEDGAADNETAASGDDDGTDGENWVEYDVDDRTVDLTELQGANASMIDEFDLPAGDYETVFIYVSDTEGILTDSTETDVKLASNKLHLNSKFTVGDGERVDFVYDIAPHKAGGSGKYVLKPVIGQSGTGDDIEIRDVDKEAENEGDDEDENRGNGGNGNGAPEANETDE